MDKPVIYYCPVCGTALILQYSDKIGRFEHHTMSCQNDKCALDWTVLEDADNGNFLGIQRFFHG